MLLVHKLDTSTYKFVKKFVTIFNHLGTIGLTPQKLLEMVGSYSYIIYLLYTLRALYIFLLCVV